MIDQAAADTRLYRIGVYPAHLAMAQAHYNSNKEFRTGTARH
jgi:hypothetical protein